MDRIGSGLGIGTIVDLESLALSGGGGITPADENAGSVVSPADEKVEVSKKVVLPKTNLADLARLLASLLHQMGGSNLSDTIPKFENALTSYWPQFPSRQLFNIINRDDWYELAIVCPKGISTDQQGFVALGSEQGLDQLLAACDTLSTPCQVLLNWVRKDDKSDEITHSAYSVLQVSRFSSPRFGVTYHQKYSWGVEDVKYTAYNSLEELQKAVAERVKEGDIEYTHIRAIELDRRERWGDRDIRG